MLGLTGLLFLVGALLSLGSNHPDIGGIVSGLIFVAAGIASFVAAQACKK